MKAGLIKLVCTNCWIAGKNVYLRGSVAPEIQDLVSKIPAHVKKILMAHYNLLGMDRETIMDYPGLVIAKTKPDYADVIGLDFMTLDNVKSIPDNKYGLCILDEVITGKDILMDISSLLSISDKIWVGKCLRQGKESSSISVGVGYLYSSDKQIDKIKIESMSIARDVLELNTISNLMGRNSSGFYFINKMGLAEANKRNMEEIEAKEALLKQKRDLEQAKKEALKTANESGMSVSSAGIQPNISMTTVRAPTSTSGVAATEVSSFDPFLVRIR